MVSRKVYIATFGCRTNQADSAGLWEDFLRRHYEETESWRNADVIVVNSCTVTHRSDQQVRQLVRRMRRDNSEARLVVTGCYAQRDPLRIARIKGVDAVVGNSHRSQLIQIAGDRSRLPSPPGHPELAAIYRGDFAKKRRMESTSAAHVGGRTRPFVKIQDGCDAKCAYCIIPAVRGPSRSVPVRRVLQQVRDLVDRGFKEVVLTGIHIGTYGRHAHPRFPLVRLLEEILAIDNLQRVRVSSIEPMELSRRVIALAAQSEGRIAPHFHICLQSGCDRILKRMRRPYTTARFARIVEEIREKIPLAGIGTDVIIGFPGETEDDHRRSLEFVERMPFTYLHVFPYSDREGTSASRMPAKTAPDVIKRRSREMRQISEKKKRHFRRSLLGNSLSVITIDDEADGRRLGVSGNYVKVKVPSSIPPNCIRNLRAVAADGEYLLCENSAVDG